MAEIPQNPQNINPNPTGNPPPCPPGVYDPNTNTVSPTRQAVNHLYNPSDKEPFELSPKARKFMTKGLVIIVVLL